MNQKNDPSEESNPYLIENQFPFPEKSTTIPDDFIPIISWRGWRVFDEGETVDSRHTNESLETKYGHLYPLVFNSPTWLLREPMVNICQTFFPTRDANDRVIKGFCEEEEYNAAVTGGILSRYEKIKQREDAIVAKWGIEHPELSGIKVYKAAPLMKAALTIYEKKLTRLEQIEPVEPHLGEADASKKLPHPLPLHVKIDTITEHGVETKKLAVCPNCGIYTFDREGIKRDGNDLWKHRVFGAVRIWGRMCIHEGGYRSEFAYPMFLAVKDEGDIEKSMKLRDTLEENYGVPVCISILKEHKFSLPKGSSDKDLTKIINRRSRSVSRRVFESLLKRWYKLEPVKRVLAIREMSEYYGNTKEDNFQVTEHVFYVFRKESEEENREMIKILDEAFGNLWGDKRQKKD